MKSKLQYAAGLVTLTLILPASADVIYSGLLDYTIPTTFAGLTVSVGDGTLNPFFGGVGVANNAALQPLRDGTGGLDTILNLGTGSTIDGSSLYLATGDGGSLDHVGTGSSQFVAGDLGYLGFKLDGTNYGWMRVVFTNNTSSPVAPVIKDWAYDNTTGAATTTGNITQSAPSGSTQTVTLTSASGNSFTLGTQITDSLGNTGGVTNSVVKEGAGTAMLTGSNTYSGSTVVSNGTLLVSGSLTGTGAVTVDSGATLGGTGVIAGAVNVTGVLAPGASVGTLATGTLTMNGGSTFQYETDSSVALGVGADFQKVTGDLTLSGTVTLSLADIAATDTAFGMGTRFSLINYTGAWNSGLFTYDHATLADGAQFTAGLTTWEIDYNATSGGSNFSSDYVAGSFVNITAIPETGAGLLGGLGVLILLRRRRV